MAEIEITPKLVDYLLYNYTALRDQAEAPLPKSSASVVVVCFNRQPRLGRPVEQVAIKRATLSLVLDAVRRAIEHLPRDHKNVYRLKYRVGLTHERIAKRLYMHKDTVQNKVHDIREAVTQYLQALPGSALDEFFRQISA